MVVFRPGLIRSRIAGHAPSHGGFRPHLRAGLDGLGCRGSTGFCLGKMGKTPQVVWHFCRENIWKYANIDENRMISRLIDVPYCQTSIYNDMQRPRRSKRLDHPKSVSRLLSGVCTILRGFCETPVFCGWWNDFEKLGNTIRPQWVKQFGYLQ